MKATVKGIRLTEGQKKIYEAAHDENIKYIIAAYSRQSGKSVIVRLLCIEWLLAKNETIIYITPTYKLAKTFYSEIRKLLPDEVILAANSADLVIETISGSKLIFASGEAAQSIRGLTATKMVIDEAAYIKEQTDGQNTYSNIIWPVTKVRCTKVIMISTPFGKQGFFYENFQKALSGNYPDMFCLKRTIYDDELISKEEIEKLKEDYPEMAWKCEFECQFLTGALSIFGEFDELFKEENLHLTNCWAGIDLSANGSDDTVLSFIDSSNRVEQHLINGSLDEKYEKIADLLNDRSPKCTYIESNSIGEVMINEIKKRLNSKTKFKPFLTTNATKKEQASEAMNLVEKKQISFEKKNHLLQSQMGTFSYNLTKNGNITFAAAAGYHDDTVLSLFLAIQCKKDNYSSSKPVFVSSNNYFLN